MLYEVITLLELAHREDRDLLAVELAELVEEHAADRDVHADAERVRPADHAQQAALRQALHQQPVAREHAGVVHADAEAEPAREVLPEGRIEAESYNFV